MASWNPVLFMVEVGAAMVVILVPTFAVFMQQDNHLFKTRFWVYLLMRGCTEMVIAGLWLWVTQAHGSPQDPAIAKVAFYFMAQAGRMVLQILDVARMVHYAVLNYHQNLMAADASLASALRGEIPRLKAEMDLSTGVLPSMPDMTPLSSPSGLLEQAVECTIDDGNRTRDTLHPTHSQTLQAASKPPTIKARVIVLYARWIYAVGGERMPPRVSPSRIGALCVIACAILAAAMSLFPVTSTPLQDAASLQLYAVGYLLLYPVGYWLMADAREDLALLTEQTLAFCTTYLLTLAQVVQCIVKQTYGANIESVQILLPLLASLTGVLVHYTFPLAVAFRRKRAADELQREMSALRRKLQDPTALAKIKILCRRSYCIELALFCENLTALMRMERRLLRQKAEPPIASSALTSGRPDNLPGLAGIHTLQRSSRLAGRALTMETGVRSPADLLASESGSYQADSSTLILANAIRGIQRRTMSALPQVMARSVRKESLLGGKEQQLPQSIVLTALQQHKPYVDAVRTVYSRFLAIDAQLELDVSSEARCRARHAIRDRRYTTAAAFGLAFEEVCAMLFVDIYPAYLRSTAAAAVATSGTWSRRLKGLTG
ncbi:hypothetical protein RI367_001949 [Sorochytrium milnesiophthora]